METGIKVGDVMAKGVVTISPDETVKKACETMAKHDLSGITVVEKGKVVGMLTQGDLVKVIANEENPAVIKAKEIMGTKEIGINPEADVKEAAEVMVQNKVKRLPVLKNKKLVGVITQTDIVRLSPSVYDLIFEKAKIEEGCLLENEIGMSGECEECNNFSENLRNVNGTLVCEECYENIEEQV
jgi:CBS domain-containing protein